MTQLCDCTSEDRAPSVRARIKTLALGGVSALAVLAVAGTVFAQPVIEEISVTAQKRSENVQDVPIAITAFSSSSLKKKGLTNIAQIGDFTPNVEIDGTSSFSGSTQVLSAFIRGIGQADFAFNLDPGVGIYVDGVYYARTFGAVVDLLDLERIEVLKGPQGTLFGRNTIGGAISIITRRPEEDFSVRGELTVGRFNRVDVRGSVDFPLVEGKLLSQISFSSKTRNGYHDNALWPGRYVTDARKFVLPDRTFNSEAGGENTQNIRAKLEWRGSENLTVLVSGDYTHVNEQATPSVLLAVNPGLLDVYNACITTPAAALIGGPLETICTSPRAVVGGALAGVNVDGDPSNDRLVFDDTLITGEIDRSYPAGANYSKANAFGLSVTVDWDIWDNISLKSITAFRDLDAQFAQDVDGTAVTMGDHAFDTSQWQVSQELQLTGSSFANSLEWVLGLYAFHEEGDLTDFPAFAGGLLQIVGPNEFNTEAYAAFGHAKYAVTDRLGVTLGMRYTIENKEFFGAQRDLNSLAFKLGFPIFLHPDPADTTLYFPSTLNKKNFYNLSFKAGLEYFFMEDVLTYFSFSQGYKSGGWTTRATVPILEAPSFNEETADTFELGLKGEFFDHRLQTNAALFFTMYDDLQVTVQDGISPVTENAATSEIKGIELEFQSLVTDYLSINGAVGYIDAEYTKLDPGTSLSKDFLFLNTPKWSASLTGEYTVPLSSGASVILHMDWSYKSRVANDGENTPELIADPVNLIGALIRYEEPKGRWSASVGGRNLTDKRYIVAGQNQSGVGYIGGTYSRPREWYLSFNFQF